MHHRDEALAVSLHHHLQRLQQENFMRTVIALILLFVSVSFAAKDNDQHLQDRMQLEQLIKTATLAVEACGRWVQRTVW